MTRQSVRLSTVVMTHPRRDEAARRLQSQYPELEMRIVHDPDPSGPPATLRTARLAWKTVAESATHHLVLQDDVELCDEFAAAAYQAIASGPSGPLSFFANWASRSGQLVRLAALSGASWAPVMDPYIPTQALLLPAPLALEFAEFAETLPSTVPDNQAMAHFLRSKEMTASVCCPNLVEHADADSLLLHDVMFGVRRSVVFPRNGEQVSGALESGTVESRCIPHFESLSGFSIVFFREGRGDESTWSMTSHEVLGDCGMSKSDIVGKFREDLAKNPQAAPPVSGLSHPFVFQLWITSFILGAVASQLLGGPDRDVLDIGLKRPWARQALETIPAGKLRRFVPAEQLAEASARLLGLCTDALGAGFVAPAQWPELLDIPFRFKEPEHHKRRGSAYPDTRSTGLSRAGGNGS